MVMFSQLFCQSVPRIVEPSGPSFTDWITWRSTISQFFFQTQIFQFFRMRRVIEHWSHDLLGKIGRWHRINTKIICTGNSMICMYPNSNKSSKLKRFFFFSSSTCESFSQFVTSPDTRENNSTRDPASNSRCRYVLPMKERLVGGLLSLHASA